MEFVNDIKAMVPDYAKDIRLNLDSVLLRSSLSQEEAIGAALSAAFACGNPIIVNKLRDGGVLSDTQVTAAMTAASLMAMNNVYYPFVEMAGDDDIKNQRPELRMNAYANFGGVDKKQFEMYALSASIIGKCHFCVQSHYALLRKEGMTAVQLRDVGRIAAVISAVCTVTSI